MGKRGGFGLLIHRESSEREGERNGKRERKREREREKERGREIIIIIMDTYSA